MYACDTGQPEQIAEPPGQRIVFLIQKKPPVGQRISHTHGFCRKRIDKCLDNIAFIFHASSSDCDASVEGIIETLLDMII